MSLAQHVTAIEGFDREATWQPPADEEECYQQADLDLEAKPEWRRLSFDAFAAPEEDVPVPVPHVAAYRTSNALRALQVTSAVAACCLLSGIIFGFAALKPVLVAVGVYSDLCDDDDDGRDGPAPPCTEQDMRLNLFFVAGSITTNVASLFAGAALDRFGRRVCYVVASLVLAAACLLMGFAFAIPEFDGYLMANVCLGLGGAFVFVPSFQLANAFPKYSGIIVALVTGAFDASAAVYLLYQMAFEASAGSITPSRFFFAYVSVPVLVLAAEWAYMPSSAYHSTPELEVKIEKAQDRSRDVHDSDDNISDTGELLRVRDERAEARLAKLDQIEELVGDAEMREDRLKQEEERQAISGVWGVLHGLPAHRQMLSPWFIFILLLTLLQMLRMNYFIATIRAQYRHMLADEQLAEDVNHFFDVALPVGGVVATPFIGVLLNNLSVEVTCATLTVFIAVIGVLNCLPYVWAAYATVVAFVLFRPLYYSAMSDYATKVFGFATFGRIYGMIVCLSGLFSFLQSGLDAVTHGPLNGDPTPVNAGMAVAGTVLGLALTAYVAVNGRQYREIVGEEEQLAESERLIPEEPEGYGTV